jgi:hypothetical protein
MILRCKMARFYCGSLKKAANGFLHRLNAADKKAA